jgi:hypothetical protein
MPGYEEAVQSISLDADASIGIYTGVPGLPGSASPNGGMQYRFVKITGVHQAGLATAAADPVVGVLRNKPQHTGDPATVGVRGVVLLTAGAAISAGMALCSNSTGEAVQDTNAVANRKCYAVGTASGVGVLFPALLI